MAADPKPIIGICSYAQDAAWGAWRLPAALLPLSYVLSVQVAGGRPVLLPPQTDGVGETLDAIDGLILSGGADIAPELYAAERDARTDAAQAHRDAAELALLAGALERELPVLAICRGMQLLNVARGGSLAQHLPDGVGHERHRETVGVFSDHDVHIDGASRIGRILGLEAAVKSHHHQGIERVGAGLEAVGWADDGTIEAIEDPGRAFALGVLWHPEEGEDTRLFEALVARARAYRAERAR